MMAAWGRAENEGDENVGREKETHATAGVKFQKSKMLDMKIVKM